MRKELTMRISDIEVKKILDGEHVVIELPESLGTEAPTQNADAELIRSVTSNVMQMPDREEMIASLKARIDAGTYNVSGADIADAMARRAIADSVR
jgi:negative regulator of flagellin synthesis FlgM